jgi:hypothetical protein
MAHLVVAARQNPFALDRVVEQVGPTTARALVQRYFPPSHQPYVIVFLDGKLIPIEDWDKVITSGLVGLTIRPQNRELVRIGLFFAVVVAAAATGQWAALPVAQGGLGLGVLGSSALGAAVGLAGGLLVNALVSPAELSTDGGRGSKSWSLDRVSNQARIYSAVPRAFGRIRYYPPLAAEPIPYRKKRREHVQVALCWGYGPLEVTDIKVGKTPITYFDNVQSEFFPGDPGVVPESTLFSQDVHVETINEEVVNEFGPLVRRSGVAPEQIEVVLSFPRGLVDLSDGDTDELAVTFELEYSYVDSGVWQTWVTETVRRETTNPFNLTYTLDVTGQVDVRLTRITRDRKDFAKSDSLFWRFLISRRAGNPFKLPGVAISTYDFRSGEQLSGSVDEISGVISAKVLDWNGSDWVLRETSNPASIARAVLQASGAWEPTPDSELDLAGFVRWHEYCQQHGLECNIVIDWDNATQEEVLQLVAATGDAIVPFINGRRVPVIDSVQTTPVQMFTPLNIRDLKSDLTFIDVPHGLRVRFLNEERDYEPDERVVYMDGYGPDNASKFEDFEIPGVTSPKLIYRHARRRLAEILLRRERFTWLSPWDWLTCRVGDLVHLSHHALGVGVSWSRVLKVYTDRENRITGVDLTSPVNLKEEGSYGARIRGAEIYTVAISRFTSTHLDFETPLDGSVEVDDLVSIGDLQVETIPLLITNIRPAEQLMAEITAVRYHDGVYKADTEVIPPWSSGISSSLLEPPIVTFAIWDYRTSEAVLAVEDTGTYTQPLAALEIGWRYNPEDTMTINSYPPDTSSVRLTLARDALVQGRWRTLNGRVSLWSPTVRVSTSRAAQTISSFGVSSAWIDSDYLRWAMRDTSKHYDGWQIRYGPPGVPWELATPLHQGLLQTQYFPISNLPFYNCELLITVYYNGVPSEPYRLPYAPADLGGDRYDLWSVDYKTLGWPGVLPSHVQKTDILTSENSLWMFPAPGEPMFPAPEAPMFVPRGAEFTYRTEFEFPDGFEPSDVLIIQPIGVVSALQYTREVRTLVETAFDDETVFDDGTRFTEAGVGSYLPWPGELRYQAGAKIEVTIVASYLEHLYFKIRGRARKYYQTNVVVSPDGTVIQLEAPYRFVLAVHAIPIGNATVRVISKEPEVVVASDVETLADITVEYV